MWSASAAVVFSYMQRVYQFHMDSATGKVTEEHVLGYYHKAETELAAERDREAAPTAASRAWHAQHKALQEGGRATGSKKAGEADKQDALTVDIAASREKIYKSVLDALDGISEAAADTADTLADPSGTASHEDTKATSTGAESTKAVSALSDQWSKNAPPMLELLDYLPDTVSMLESYWPYYRQMYAGGEPCGSEGAGKPRTVELRVACSPHKTMQLLIREPQFCQYVMVLYHPELCHLPRYKPVSKVAAKKSAGGGQSMSDNKTAQGKRVADEDWA